MDAFLAYLNGDARFTVVRQEEFTMDGHRAVEVELHFGENLTAPCWTLDGDSNDRTGILTWVPQAAGGGFWNDSIGGRNILVVTEADGVTLTFEALTFAGRDFQVDRASLDTVRFLDALPASPAG
ncbi:MAG: hypothetical protein ACSLFN_04920 [Candidatus Limnocylindrales bacterium]